MTNVKNYGPVTYTQHRLTDFWIAIKYKRNQYPAQVYAAICKEYDALKREIAVMCNVL